MNTTPITFRLFSAAAAVAVTLGLLGTVCNIAAPQHDALMAKVHGNQQQATVVVAAAASRTVVR